jgi:hypothetical protein
MPGFKSDYMFVTLKKENSHQVGTFEYYLKIEKKVLDPKDPKDDTIHVHPDPGTIGKKDIIKYRKVVKEKIIESSNEGLYHFSGFDFTKLDEIQCSPILKPGFKTKKLNSKDIVSLNNGVDFGLIHIYKKGYERRNEG